MSDLIAKYHTPITKLKKKAYRQEFHDKEILAVALDCVYSYTINLLDTESVHCYLEQVLLYLELHQMPYGPPS